MKPSLVARALLALLRGSGSEYLRGDLEEWLVEEEQRRQSGRRRSFEIEVLRSLMSWWGPASLVQRWSRRDRTQHDLIRELRLTVRGLIRKPGYSLLVVIVVGVGIGTTTTVLTIVDRVLIRSLPVPEPERLTVIGSIFPDRQWRTDAPGLQRLVGFSLANFLDWDERTRVFERLGAYDRMGLLLPDEGSGPELIQSAAITPDFLEILQVRPALGRLFLPHEYSLSSDEVVVLSHGAWTTRYGADPNVLGNTLTSDDGSAVIVGVLPEDFEVPEALGPETFPLWFPIKLNSERYADRGGRGLRGVGLLARGQSVASARAELGELAAQLAVEFPDGNVYPDGRRLEAGANALQAQTIGAARKPIVLFMGAALLLLLISGLNTANLTLVRGLARDREIRVRRALGASRGSLVRLFFVEAMILSLIGGVLGLGLAHIGIGAFRELAPTSIPRLSEITLDGRIVLFALTITMAAGLVTGLLPALRLTERRSGVSLRDPGRRVMGRTGVFPWTVATQVALSMLLMVSAGLLMESFLRLRAFDPGFNSDSALTFQQALKAPNTREQPSYLLWDNLLEQMQEVPGFTQVAAGSNLPFQSPNWAPWVLLPGDRDDSHRTGIAGYVISNNYFETLGIPLRRGRGFESLDGPESQAVVVVNEAFLSTHMPGQEPLGTILRLRRGEAFEEKRIVGVVGNTVQTRPEEGLLPAIYVPTTQEDWPSAWVFARATGEPLAGLEQVREAANRANPYVPPRSVATMSDRIGRTRLGSRFNASLALAFGCVSLLLAAGGLYGALSFAVGRRTNEIGVRLALGATRPSVMRLVLGQGLRVTLIGVVVGLVSALFGGHLIRSFLFAVEPTSVPAIVVVTATLLGVAALACLAPALRATRVDPVRSLNAE